MGETPASPQQPTGEEPEPSTEPGDESQQAGQAGQAPGAMSPEDEAPPIKYYGGTES